MHGRTLTHVSLFTFTLVLTLNGGLIKAMAQSTDAESNTDETGTGDESPEAQPNIGADFRQTPEGWEELGTYTLDPSAEELTIEVRTLGTHDRLRFHVAGNDLEISRIVIAYINTAGRVLRVSLDEQLAPGDRTSAFALPTHARYIENITVSYRANGNFDGPPRIRLIGHISPDGAQPPPPEAANRQQESGLNFRTPPEGWDVLTTHSLDLMSSEANIPIQSNGNHDMIRFYVADNDIEIRDVVINYRDSRGRSLVFDAELQIQAGGRTGRFRIPAHARQIESITFRYNVVGRYAVPARIRVVARPTPPTAESP